ncbi:Hpt domain-containing protein [Burkholderiaceae bacterium DAT-1]|nr:Hpt domain-containing protein [Burkholderiaceae bacterium DAT-1]
MPLPDDFEAKLAKLRLDYLASLPAKLDEMEAAFHHSIDHIESRRDFARMAHSLAGTGATFGMPDLTAWAREIEYGAKAEQGSETPWSAQFAELFNRALRDIRMLVQSQIASE